MRKTSHVPHRAGPVFTNILLADEINRATPKTQSALLEAMQERQVTPADTTFPLDDPFWVLATQNPVEQEGVYTLPEAQLDRFSMMLRVGYPSGGEKSRCCRQRLTRTTIERRCRRPTSRLREFIHRRSTSTTRVLEYIVALWARDPHPAGGPPDVCAR
jgi:MoxR-like ATPase